ncbi:VOC family protein [Croceicoccus sediminis]|uniref:VOC family protein n=1 Tax=Croceicoccus sediminis TaxID=2571150 RepID=UPI001478DA3B|nr:VOC family protein [Croceicoccus sediminis]
MTSGSTPQTNGHFIKDLGPIFQVAYVEKDFREAIGRWNALGVGPFFVIERVPVPNIYKGQEREATLTLAFSYWGDMQVEIIQQYDEGPSVYRDWMDGSQAGIHHVCILVDDMAGIPERCAREGLSVEQEMKTASAHVIYARMHEGASHYVEFAQYAPGTGPLFDRIRDVCANWDGSDPIRSLGDFI